MEADKEWSTLLCLDMIGYDCCIAHLNVCVSRNFSRRGQHQHFAYLCQVADDAMEVYVRETLYRFYTTTPQRKCPML